MRYHETKISVRFNEVDAYRVAWHGHYVAWMEIGRTALAGRFDLDVSQLEALGYLGPVVGLELKFFRSARFNDKLTILTSLRNTETATLEFITEIRGADGTKLATGSTTHALTDMDGVLQFRLPAIVEERLNRMLEWLESE
jgi:acyl-CoA thioester hydrolase